MKPNPQKQRASMKREETAAEWIIKQDHGLTAAQQDEFNEWLSNDPHNRKAYSELFFAWEEIDRLAGFQSSPQAPVNPNLLDDWTPTSRRINRWIYWCGALPIAATVVLSFGIFFNSRSHVEPEVVEPAQEIVFERVRKQQLPDGSVVSLNRGAVIDVEFTGSARMVRLLEGEANFVVAKNQEKPFWVEAKGVKLRAVGTTFNVRISQGEIDVIVTEGTVAIEGGYEENGSEPFLEANHRAVFSFDPSVPEIEIEQLAEDTVEVELLWIPKLIDFENVPLSLIVDEFNRRNPIHIVIQDKELQELRLSSVFWSDNVAGFIRLLKAKFQIQAFSTEDGTIYLTLPTYAQK